METYKKAHARVLAELQALGWETRTALKVPWAKHGARTLTFKPQAIYLNGHSMFVDMRGMSTTFLVSVVDRRVQP